ncbi:sensor histidine kinase [[Eubacterium] hominis]|uniref:sensor histidine kinase n=1 Tax=[Eubacterium] hominis TaxID=2764325 RepID=UPI003A4E3289
MKQYKAIGIILVVLFLSYLSMQILFRYDNKYYHSQAPIQQGVLDIDTLQLDKDQLYSLVDDWDFYPHAYLQKEQEDVDKTSIYLGQFPDYSMRDKLLSPYGISTYHIKLTSTKQTTIAIFIPEVDSAYELWVDQDLVLMRGDIHTDPIEDYVKNSTITLEVQGSCDLYINIGNDTHYYSGLYFPPIISSIDGIQSMILKKVIFYSFLCFSTLSIACFSMGLWLKNKRNAIHLTYGIAAMSFACYISMELWRFLGFSHIRFAYAWNDFFYFLMLACIVSINANLSKVQKKRWYRLGMLPLAILICFITLLVPICFPHMDATSLYWYGMLIDGYKYISVVFILYTSVLGFQIQSSIYLWILAANCFDVLGILYTLYHRNAFEPMVYGWPNEYVSFMIILLFTLFMIRKNHHMMIENETLTLHLQETVAKRTLQLETLLNERKALLCELTHDVKAPLSSIHSLVEVIQKGDIQIDQEVQNYLNIIKQKSDEVHVRMKELQHFSKADMIVIQRDRFCIQDFLQRFYEWNKPDCDACAIHFILDMEATPWYLYGNEEQLQRVFENLLFNALDFTPPNGHIWVQQTSKEDEIEIKFIDDGLGISQEHIDDIFEQGISFCRNQKEEHGLGLYIARSIIFQHGGQIHVESEKGKGTCFIIHLPKQKRKE